MRSSPWAVTAALVLLAASNAGAGDVGNPKGERNLARMLDGRVAGEPVDCIEVKRAFSTEIVDKTAIVYSMPGGKLYVNRPRKGRDALQPQYVVWSRGGRLACDRQGVALLDAGGKGGGYNNNTVWLGPFVPYTKSEQ